MHLPQPWHHHPDVLSRFTEQCQRLDGARRRQRTDGLFSLLECRGYMWNKIVSKWNYFRELLQLVYIFQLVKCRRNFRTLSAAEIILFQFQMWLHVKMKHWNNFEIIMLTKHPWAQSSFFTFLLLSFSVAAIFIIV